MLRRAAFFLYPSGKIVFPLAQIGREQQPFEAADDSRASNSRTTTIKTKFQDLRLAAQRLRCYNIASSNGNLEFSVI